MAPGKTYIHKMEASELAELNDAPFLTVWWGPDKRNLHSPNNIVYNKYPAKVLEAFSDAFGENPKVVEFVAWPKFGVVKVVLDWMLACCKGDGLQQVKDIGLDLTGLTSAKDDGEFSRFFKTAYLFDFAQEYKIKHLEDKLKRELEFQAKAFTAQVTLTKLHPTNALQGKFALRVEEVYDMANYFWQPNRDDSAINLMIDSIARGYAKGDITGKRKHMYEQELAIWESDSKGDCDCIGEEFCVHDDIPEMLARRIKYFEDPKNKEELDEVFGKKAEVVKDAPAGDGGGWNNGEDWGGAGKVDEGDKENQAPIEDWGDEMNSAAAGNEWDTPAVASGSTGGW